MKKSIRAGERAAVLLAADTRACYRPDCRRSLVVARGSERIADFEVAHIRDELKPASPDSDIGWRYWPDDLTQDERNRFENLILLCSPCHKLIDKVRPRDFTVAELHEWKRLAEVRLEAPTDEVGYPFDVDELRAALAAELLAQSAVELTLPSLTTIDGLSFASRVTDIVDRGAELRALRDFFDKDVPFSWWLVGGAAGAGKSRLALEACLNLSDEWAAGFVTEPQQQELLRLVPEQPTALVIDYASARAEWLGQLLLNLANNARDGWSPVRVLALERGIGADARWLAVATRRRIHHESVTILEHQHAEPLHLPGLGREGLTRLVEAASPSTIPATEVEYIVDRALELDPEQRPLFGLIATLERFDDAVSGGPRDGVLRSLIQRRLSQEAIESLPAQEVLVVATALGGLAYSEFGVLSESSAHPAIAGLADRPVEDLEGLLGGMTPDILGEMWVLDRLDLGGVQAEVAKAALGYSWSASPERYASFVDRCARDHPGHQSISKLLDVDSSTAPAEWFALAPSVIAHLRDPKSTVVSEIVELISRSDPCPERDEAEAAAQLRVANLWMSLGRLDTAHSVLSDTIESAPSGSEVRWRCLTNRGVIHSQIEEDDLAAADWSAVVDSDDASDESRACCLNNLADLRVDAGDHEEAISLRSRVLELTETTYNRRYIALIRRANSLWELGRWSEAVSDLERLLETSDIAVEQKNKARVTRAVWALEHDDEATARRELAIVNESRRNFPDVERVATEMWDELKHEPA